MSARRRGARACAALGLVGLVIAAWLAAPVRHGATRALRVLVIDRSRSVERTRSTFDAWARRTIEREARAAADGDFAVVTFGGDVRLACPPIDADTIVRDPARAWPSDGAVARAASPLDRALQLAREIASGYAPLTLVLATDGAYTGVDPTATLEALADGGATITRLALPPPDRGDARVLAVTTAEELEPGAPIAVEAEIAASAPYPSATCEVVFRASRSVSSHDRETIVALPLAEDGGDFRGRVTGALGPALPGRTTIDVRVRWKRADGALLADAIPENDVSQATVVARGALVVGGIADRASRAALRSNFDGVEGVQWIELDAARVSLDGVDVLVTAGVRFDELDAKRVAAFVARGGGWLACADEAWLASEEQAAELWWLLPLRPAAAADGGAELVLLVDGSGSMVGEPFDAVLAALPDVIDAAPLATAVETCFFADELRDCRRFEASADRRVRREHVLRALPQRAPGGPTRVFAALESLAARRRNASDQRTARVVLLSDGRDTSEPDVAARGARVRAQLDLARIELALIAAGATPDLALLEVLRGPSTPLFHARALAHEELAALFTRAAAGERVKSGAFSLRAAISTLDAGATDADALVRSIVAAQDPSAPRPPLERLVVTRVDERASLLWRAGTDPACAWMRVGAGSTAACAFTPEMSSGVALDHAFYLPLVRALGRSARERAPRAAQRGDELVVSGLDARTPALVHARALLADGEVPIALAPDARDPLRARSAPWPRALDGVGERPIVELAIDGLGETLALELRADPESRAMERLLALPQPRGASGRARAEAAHPGLAAVLAAALALLCASAFLGILRRGA
ncbi:MAG: VWA domain-containing protein [Planctomycetota bacterium]